MGTRVNPDGAKIRALRIQRGWTQEQLAEIAGVSARTIQRAETADCAAFETVRAVAGAFNTDFDQLLKSGTGGISDPKPRELPQSEPVSAPGREPGGMIVALAPAHSVRRSCRTFQIAAAVFAGLITGVILTYRFVAPAGSHLSAPPSNSTAPARPEAWNRVQPDTNARRPSPVPRNAGGQVTEPAVPERRIEPGAESPGYHISGAPAAAIFEPAGIASPNAIHSSPQPAIPGLSLPSRDPMASFAALEAQARLGALSVLSAGVARKDQGDGVVRQAMGQAGKKMGEVFAKIGASMKRVF